MQRCLEKGSRKQKMVLADVIIKHLSALIEDPFGNYLVQNVLKLESSEKSDMIFRVIAKDFVRLSQLKFSSNVIEKCLQSGDGLAVSIVAQEITSAKSFGHLLHDPFANYVVQTRECTSTHHQLHCLLRDLLSQAMCVQC